MGPVDLVIFDCDGVLVDSEALGCGVQAECLTEAGFPISLSEILTEFVGKSDASMFAAVEARHGRRLPTDLKAEIKIRVLDSFRSALQLVAGIPEVLDGLDRPVCVASSSDPDRIRLCLELTKLLPYFEPHLFSATMVQAGKPAPDLFLHAAAEMGVAAGRCIVVEDSVPGVTAALAARMPVIGLSAASHCDANHAGRLRAVGATEVVTSTAALAASLARFTRQGSTAPRSFRA